MKSVVLAFIAGCASLVTGQESSPSSSAAPSLVQPGAASPVSTVTVGQDSSQFVPDSLTANIGDIVQFRFFPPNHSVGRAEYKKPCVPYEGTGMNKIGFWSGFFPLGTNDNPPTWNLTINDTEPVFFYCAAPTSCIDFQMVGVINPNSSVSLNTQKQEASQSQFMLAPGEPFPSEGDSPPGSVVSTASSSSSPSPTDSSGPASSSSSPSPTDSSGPAPAPSGGLSKGEIAGIVVGSAVVALLAAALFILLSRHKTTLKFIQEYRHQASGPQNPPGDQDWKSPNLDASTCPYSPSTIPSSETPDYHDGKHASPPYTEHISQHPDAPSPTAIAELASPMDKQSQECLEIDERPSQRPYSDDPNARLASPQTHLAPLLWGRSMSTRTHRVSELATD